jgi:hypothetical protein
MAAHKFSEIDEIGKTFPRIQPGYFPAVEACRSGPDWSRNAVETGRSPEAPVHQKTTSTTVDMSRTASFIFFAVLVAVAHAQTYTYNDYESATCSGKATTTYKAENNACVVTGTGASGGSAQVKVSGSVPLRCQL